MIEKYWLDFRKIQATKKEAEKKGCFVLEIADLDITTKNKAPECPTIKDKCL